MIVARSFLYHGLFEYFKSHNITSLEELNAYKEKWDTFKEIVPNWPGFKRLSLTEADKKCLQEGLDEPNPFD